MESEPHSTSSLDATLLARIARGDSAAFSEFYDQYSGTLYSIAMAILNRQADAEEVLQDVFVTIWQKAGTYNPRLGKPATWAITITRNRSVDRLRSLKRTAELMQKNAEEMHSQPWHEVDATTLLACREDQHRVLNALAEIPAEQMEAIRMAYFGGLSQSEIAAALNQPLGTIKARIRRGMERVRGILESDPDAGQIEPNTP